MKFVQRYESHRYLGALSEQLLKTQMIAWGEIAGELYIYSSFAEADECAPGSVTNEFKRDAEIAFAVAAAVSA